ncbi:hypothetical protein IWX65_002643 [Arthrobacter sp. CAN_A214]
MTANLPDRPSALTRRGPRPAPDETVDPVHFVPSSRQDLAPAAVSRPQEPAIKPAKRKRELTFPFSTRLSEDVQDILDKAVESEGITVREAVEQAIRSRWGSHG